MSRIYGELSMAVTEADIQAFAAFAREQAANGGADLTLAELAVKWQAVRQREEVNCAIRDSLADIDAGRTETFFDAQDSFRRDRNLPPRR
jgi:hypothetical protein